MVTFIQQQDYMAKYLKLYKERKIMMKVIMSILTIPLDLEKMIKDKETKLYRTLQGYSLDLEKTVERNLDRGFYPDFFHVFNETKNPYKD